MRLPTRLTGHAPGAWALAAGLVCLPAAALPPRSFGRPGGVTARWNAGEGPVASALRAKVTPEVIARWSPDVHFHEWERYFLTSAEELFKGAKAFRVGSKESTRAAWGPTRPIRHLRWWTSTANP
jgi:hypothetical protein